MNTFSDAQLLVSSDVTGLMDRVSRGDAAFNDDERETLETLVENGFVVESRDDERAALDKYFRDAPRRHRTAARDGADHAAVQLRVRLLLPGRPRRLQQVRREDVARNGGEVVAWIESRLDEVRPGEVRAHAVRRRAAAEPAGRVLPGGACHALCAGARHPAGPERDHERAAADAGRRRRGSSRSVSTASRSRSTATATRTTACVRFAAARGRSTGSSRTSGGCAHGADHHRRQLRRVVC